ncbi:hypothetical protein Taro_042418 [Colocasia esculenta]|uniref:Uncharacterized protein n=1 Tax=Colocasia esculenta TaxID=4460 RepID=A0A843WZJ2_COLES|nr:hypothetical protein [Colocasia esculenta]
MSPPSQRRGTSPEGLRERILERQTASGFPGTQKHLASVGEEKSLRRGSPRESLAPLEAGKRWKFLTQAVVYSRTFVVFRANLPPEVCLNPDIFFGFNNPLKHSRSTGSQPPFSLFSAFQEERKGEKPFPLRSAAPAGQIPLFSLKEVREERPRPKGDPLE